MNGPEAIVISNYTKKMLSVIIAIPVTRTFQRAATFFIRVVTSIARLPATINTTEKERIKE